MLHDLEISGPVMLVLNAVGPARTGICRDDIKLTTELRSVSLYPILIQLERAGCSAMATDNGDLMVTLPCLSEQASGIVSVNKQGFWSSFLPLQEIALATHSGPLYRSLYAAQITGDVEEAEVTEDDIPEFVNEVLATGCEILAIGDDGYVIADCHLPEEVYHAMEPALAQIADKYFARGHLKSQIVEYLRSIGRIYPPSEPHWCH